MRKVTGETIKDGKFHFIMWNFTTIHVENVTMHTDFSGHKSILKRNTRSFPGYVTPTLLKG